jgi:ferrous iron transport protein B
MSTARNPAWSIDYGPILEAEISRIQRAIEKYAQISNAYEPRWLAVKLLEGEQDLSARLGDFEGGVEVIRIVQSSLAKLSPELPGGVEIAIADRRYAFVNKVVADVLTYSRTRASLSERVDRVVTSPWLGVPIFLVVMYLVFHLVVNVSAPYLDWIDASISGPITSWTGELMTLVNAPGWLQGLVLDGVIAGVGGVLVFLPGLIALFLFIGILEDSGYMARAAFVMHRLMNRMGLSGRSFVALILGFGCAVPGIYATRTLDSFRERVLTGLLVPLMSCAARLPVYVVFGIAFFGSNADVVVWSLYAFGVVVAALSAWLLSHTVLKPEEHDKAFLLELPSYRFPSLRSLWFHVSQRTGGFLKNAGTVILAASIVIWLLLSLPQGTEDLRDSWFGEISAAIAPVLTPAGIGNWETSGSLVTGLIAKEVVVSTMSQIYTGASNEAELTTVGLGQGLVDIGGGFVTATRDAVLAMADALTPFTSLNGTGEQQAVDTELGLALQQAFTPLTALTFLVFVLLYVPCVATLGTIRQEFGTRWAVFSACYQTGIAWIMAVAVFQIGTLLGYA